jgi:hypothetical protein
MSYFGKIISHVYGEDKLAQKDAKLAERDEEIIQKDAKITRLMQLLSQRDTELAQKETEISFYDAELARKDIELDRKNAELDQKDAELDRKNAELDQKDAELDRKNAELDQKDAELARLVQLLSQRDEESTQNAKVLNDVKQELLSVKQELAQRDTELAQERICLRDRTLPAPIDVQVKLGEMFKSWEDPIARMGSCSSLKYLIQPLLPKIRAATEQIKEPIMGLFHVTYSEMNGCYYIYSDILLFTATDVYYLTNGVTNPEFGSNSYDIRKVVVEDRTGGTSRYAFTDPKWVKWTAISKEANFKKIITCINQLSGYTGQNRQSNPNGMNNVYLDSGSQTASARLQQLHALIF